VQPERRPEEEAGYDTIFCFTPCKNQKTPYVVAVVRTEGAPGEARLRDKAKGRGENFYLESL